MKGDEVTVDVPFIIGLGFLKKYKMYAHTVSNKSCGTALNIEVPLTRNQGHIYLQLREKEIFIFTARDPYNIHRNMDYTAIDKFLHMVILSQQCETD